MPTISVIIPVYKTETYIRQCVDSILNQTYTDFELILVDDGSPDECGAICDEYAAKDSRVVVLHQKNGGLSAARNAGIDWVFDNSDSQWIAFVDSDDWVHPEYLSFLYDAAIQNDVKISVCSFVRTTERTQPEADFKPVEIRTPTEVYLRINNMITAYAWGWICHRDGLKNVRFPLGKIYEDIFTTYKVFFSTDRIAYSDTVLYYYYCNPNSITLRKWAPSRMDEYESYRAVMRAFKNDPEMHKASMRSYLDALQRGYNRMVMWSKKDKKQFDRYRRILRRWLRKNVLLAHVRKYISLEQDANLYELAFPFLMRLYRRWTARSF